MNEQLKAAYEQYAKALRDKGLDELFLRYVYDGSNSITQPEEQAKWNDEVPSMIAFMEAHEVGKTSFLFTIAGMIANPDEGEKAVQRHLAEQQEIRNLFKPRADE